MITICEVINMSIQSWLLVHVDFKPRVGIIVEFVTLYSGTPPLWYFVLWVSVEFSNFGAVYFVIDLVLNRFSVCISRFRGT